MALRQPFHGRNIPILSSGRETFNKSLTGIIKMIIADGIGVDHAVAVIVLWGTIVKVCHAKESRTGLIPIRGID